MNVSNVYSPSDSGQLHKTDIANIKSLLVIFFILLTYSIFLYLFFFILFLITSALISNPIILVLGKYNSCNVLHSIPLEHPNDNICLGERVCQLLGKPYKSV